jgi:AcrR family transcriptional regulator
MAPQPPARERLLDAAEDLAATQGVTATPVDVILDRAQVSPATLYAHFGNKEGLVTEALRRRLARWAATWQECIDEAGTPEEKLLALFPALSRHRRSLTPSRWCVFLGVAAETPRPGRDLADTLAADTQLLTQRLEDLATALVDDGRAGMLARQITLIYTGVLGMILRGSEVEIATAEGRRIAALAVRSCISPSGSHLP